MVNVVTAAPGIAVNAAVGAAPVQVHSVLRGKNAFCLNIMHVPPHAKNIRLKIFCPEEKKYALVIHPEKTAGLYY